MPWYVLVREMKNKTIQCIKILISILLLYFLVHQIDYEEFNRVLAKVSIIGILAVVLAYLVSIIINALKWRVLLPETELKFLVVLCFRAQFYSTVLPGQLFGEASKVTVWKDRAEDTSEVAASVVFDKITGIIAQIILGVVGIYLSSKTETIANKWILVMLAVIGVLLIYVSTEQHVSKVLLRGLKLIGRVNTKLEHPLMEAYHSWCLFATQRGILIKSIFWGILNQFMGIVAIWFLSTTMGLPISLIEYCWIIPLMSVVLLLPISFAGVGLRDTSLASMLSLFEISTGSSLVISMSLLLGQFAAAIIGGLYMLKMNFVNKK